MREVCVGVLVVSNDPRAGGIAWSLRALPSRAATAAAYPNTTRWSGHRARVRGGNAMQICRSERAALLPQYRSRVASPLPRGASKAVCDDLARAAAEPATHILQNAASLTPRLAIGQVLVFVGEALSFGWERLLFGSGRGRALQLLAGAAGAPRAHRQS